MPEMGLCCADLFIVNYGVTRKTWTRKVALVLSCFLFVVFVVVVWTLTATEVTTTTYQKAFWCVLHHMVWGEDSSPIISRGEQSPKTRNFLSQKTHKQSLVMHFHGLAILFAVFRSQIYLYRSPPICTPTPPKTRKKSLHTRMPKHTPHNGNILQTSRRNREELPKQINQSINL